MKSRIKGSPAQGAVATKQKGGVVGSSTMIRFEDLMFYSTAVIGAVIVIKGFYTQIIRNNGKKQ